MKRGLLYTGGTQIAIQLMGIITGVMVSRWLGPDGRGQLASVITWGSMVAYLGNLGLPVAYAYASASQPSRRPELIKNSFVIILVQSMILGFIGWLIVPQVLAMRGEPVVRMALIFLWTYLPLNLFTLYANAIVQGSGRYGNFNIVRFSVPLIYAILLAILWLFSSISVFSIMIGTLLSNLFAAMIAGFIVYSEIKQVEGNGQASRFGVRGLLADLRYGLTAQIGAIQPFTGLKMDVLALTMISGNDEVGLYMAALAGAAALRAQGFALGQVVLPEVAKQKDFERQKHIILRVAAFSGAGSLVAVLIVMMFGRSLLEVVYGSAFVGADLMLKVLVIAGAAKVVERVLADGLRGSGHPMVSTRAELVGLAIGLPMLILAVPKWGGLGAAIAVLCASSSSLAVVVIGTVGVFHNGGAALKDTHPKQSSVTK